jgi:hypothetical protein
VVVVVVVVAVVLALAAPPRLRAVLAVTTGAATRAGAACVRGAPACVAIELPAPQPASATSSTAPAGIPRWTFTESMVRARPARAVRTAAQARPTKRRRPPQPAGAFPSLPGWMARRPDPLHLLARRPFSRGASAGVGRSVHVCLAATSPIRRTRRSSSLRPSSWAPVPSVCRRRSPILRPRRIGRSATPPHLSGSRPPSRSRTLPWGTPS